MVLVVFRLAWVFSPYGLDKPYRLPRYARRHILWNAYFSQGSTEEEKQTLMKQKKDQYKIQVVDSDFFSGH
jgi:hypothetical protein